MLRHITNRLMVFVPSVLLASIVVFGLVYLIPGGAASAIAGADAGPEQIAELERKMGLDRPPIEQYLDWLGSVLTGDLGRSFANNADIADQLQMRLPITFELAAWALILALAIGVVAGVVAAARRDRLADLVVTRMSGLGLAVPEFWIGMLAIALFAVALGWLPASGYVGWEAGGVEHLRALLLPVVVLSIGPAAIIGRITRSSMLEVLSSPFIRTAWASGIPPASVYPRFALKNVAIPLVTVVGLVVGNLLGGAVLIERIFNLPGIGSFIVNAALIKDVPAIQASVLLVVVIVMVVNLIVDLSYSLLDPRTRGDRRA